MSGSKSASRSAAVKRDGSLRYATRHLGVEKGKRGNQCKESKSECGKGTKHVQKSKLPIKRGGNNKGIISKNGKAKATSANHREKVVIVSKRSSSVSVVKSCKLRKSVSVKKVSYSTSVVLSSEDEDSDSEEESDEEKEDNSRKTRTVLKRTTSKVKSSFSDTKKSEKKSAQKAKAIKLLCEKLSSDKHQDVFANRELRPRFPYNMLQEIPTARTHRMASLNALAKVHVLYENEGRTVGENLNDADETTLIDFLNENSDDEEEDDEIDTKEMVKKESRQSGYVNDKKNEKTKAIEEKPKSDKKKSRIPEAKTVPKKRRKRKAPEVEIIDTRICKRMASLNAQAILAASYVQEPKPKRIPKKINKCDSSSDTDEKEIIVESKCDIEIIETEDKGKTPAKLKESRNNSVKQKNEKKSLKETCAENTKSSPHQAPSSEIPCHSNWSIESDVAVSETLTSRTTPLSVGNSVVASTTSTKVGLTQYTEVTKVQINTCQEGEIKEESKSEQKIKHILSNDDVAITQMYHYQSKNSNESYCVQMQTTYKPASKTIPPPVSLSSSNPINKHMNESVLPSGKNCYGGPSHSSSLPSQPYHINPNLGSMSPVIGMDHCVPRQYGGSAFTVPHYRQSQQSQFPRSEYGYYQPAGPLIQPTSDQCTIHKPVPYHPQPNLHQPPQPPISNRSAYQNFPSHQSHSNNSSTMTSHSQVSHRQKHIIPACPPPLEILPPQPKHPRYSRCHPNDEIRNRGFSNHPSYEESSRQRSQSTYSYPTQNNFPDYHKQKTDVNAFGRYSRPYEQKDNLSKNSFSANLAFNAPHQNVSKPPGSLSSPESICHNDNRNSSVSQLEMHQHPPSMHEGNHFKNLNEMVNSKERPWGARDNHSGISVTPLSLQPYQEGVKKINNVEMQDTSGYPIRPPSVIEIIDEAPRDTKTYIQLEVPRNSHREKIVVVDVETDEIEANQSLTDNSELMSPLNASTNKSFQEDVGKITVVKIEEQPIEINATATIDIPTEDCKHKDTSEIADVTILEVKKKKESAVVRRARLHGKQRTFRDCYNRPLAQLSKNKKSEISNISEEHLGKKFQPLVSLPRLVLPKPADKKPIHGWSWEGHAQDKLVYVSNDNPPCIRKCYPSICHFEGDVISVRDSVFLRSGPRKTDLPFVAKITALWENPTDGEMNMSLLWYYRPEHTDTGKKISYAEDEIFASKHRDTNSVACIEDKCYVLTYAEFCRYKKKCRLLDDTTGVLIRVVPESDENYRIRHLPPKNISPDLVLFCRRVYDYRQKRLLKNPV